MQWNPDPWPSPQKFEITLQEATTFDGFITANSNHPIVQKAVERANQRLKAVPPYKKPLVIATTFKDTQLSIETDEAYEMTFQHRLVDIHAKSIFGITRALCTLTQFVVDFRLRPCKVTDYPSFQHRGIMLDTARHFYSVKAIVKLLSSMEVVKLNRLHLHLWDAQSWPLQWTDPAISKSQLYQVGALSPTSVYSKEDIHFIMYEAAIRGIIVIPEFELLAHNDILVLVYPEITSCNPNPKKPSGQINPFAPETYQWISRFFKWALDEAFIFQTAKDGITYGCPMIHIGGDEIHKWCWETKVPPGQTYDFKAVMIQLLSHIFKELRARKRTIIAWSDLIRKEECDMGTFVDKDVIIQTWRDATHISEVMDMGYRVIASPASPHYFSAGSWATPGTGSISMTAAYSFRLGRREEQSGRVIGGEACIWSEETHEAILDKVAWPRCGSVAERYWRNGDVKDFLSENRVNYLNFWLKQVGVDPWEASTVMN
jgi:hexosaminidase